MEQVIIDGDWGGDEMQLAAVLLAAPEKVNILGATCTFGNTSHSQVVRNALNILSFLRAPHSIRVYPGAQKPSDTNMLPGDGAHGEDGIGNVNLDPSLQTASSQDAVNFILEKLRNAPEGTVTITASGPLTNIAEAIRREPDTMRKVKRIIIMGGCTHDMHACDVPVRRGNITYNAEFNFQQAAADAKKVMESGLPMTLLPMNCTHQLTLTPEREKQILQAFPYRAAGSQLIGMMSAPAALDRMKFNSDPVMHDINCALYLLNPDAYETVAGDVAVLPKDGVNGPQSMTGHTAFTGREQSNLQVATRIKDPDGLFQVFLDSIRTCIPAIVPVPRSIT